MAHWLVVVARDRYLAERLYHHDVLELAAEHGEQLADGDRVAVAAGEPLTVFALGRVVAAGHSDESDPDDPAAPEPAEADTDLVSIRYTHRMLDAPVPWPAASAPTGRPVSVTAADFGTLSQKIPAEYAVDAPRRSWLVSVDLPIEATTAPEAVRQFWSYIRQLGPAELPAYVSPAENELMMAAYVLGEETNQDPEEEDE